MQKIMFYIFAALFILGLGGSFWGGYSLANTRTAGKLSEYRALLTSTNTALEQAERSNKEAGIARDYFRGQFDSLAASITGLGSEVSEIGSGQDDLELANKNLNDAIRKHGEILGRLEN